MVITPQIKLEAKRLKEFAELVRDHVSGDGCECAERWRYTTLNLAHSADIVADAVLANTKSHSPTHPRHDGTNP